MIKRVIGNKAANMMVIKQTRQNVRTKSALRQASRPVAAQNLRTQKEVHFFLERSRAFQTKPAYILEKEIQDKQSL